MARLYFCVDDYLDGASDRALAIELKRRQARPGWKDEPDQNGVQPWTCRGMSDDIRQAYYARNVSRLELLLTQLEAREVA